MQGSNGLGDRINSFALVSYLPEPLAGFLNSLRRELVCDCRANVHVTVLPPRPLYGSSPDEAWHELDVGMEDFSAFRVDLGEIKVFPGTNVIYLSVNAGFEKLERMHHSLNSGRLYFAEPYTYHPHVTLAQGISPEDVESATNLAVRRWAEFAHSRNFIVEQMTFVQNTKQDRWTDLAGKILTSKVATSR